MAMRHDGPLPPSVRDILREEEALRYHGFDISCREGQVLIANDNFLVRIRFVGEDMVVSLDLSRATVIDSRNRIIPLGDPECFEDLATVILGWFRS